MKIFVKVKPSAKEEKIVQESPNQFSVWVREPAEENKANRAVVRVLAEYFKVEKSAVWIVAGKTSRTKIIEVEIGGCLGIK
mgnify:FL=1